MATLTAQEKYILDYMNLIVKGANHHADYIKSYIDGEFEKKGLDKKANVADIQLALDSMLAKKVIKTRKVRTFQYFVGDNRPGVYAMVSYYYF